MSKTYKLKRIYLILKVLAALSIGGMTLLSFINVVGSAYTNQDVVLLVVGLICTAYFTVSYLKVDMERDDLMEKITQTVNDNRKWVKVNRKVSEANADKIAKLEKKRGKR